MSEPIRKNEKKKGLLRLFELLDRDGGKFFKSGLLAVVSMVPFIYFMTMAVAGEKPLMLLGCALGGLLAAPQICGAADTVMRSMRDEIGWWWWETYRKAWLRNVKATLLPGAAAGLLIGLELYSLYVIALLPDPVKDFWMLFAAVLVELAICGYYLPMLVCMDIPAPALIRNCFALFFCHPIKSLLSALVQIIYYIIVLIWFPLTSVLLVLTSVWLPMLISFQILYSALDKHFGLTELYENLQKAKWEGETVAEE